MDLFGADPASNLLPCDGVVNYHGVVFPETGRFMAELLEALRWDHDETVIFGKRHVTARKVAWVADEGLSYSYSGTSKTAQPWNACLTELKRVVESRTGSRYNSCLLNFYHDGGEGMGWHSDDEKALVEGASIAAISFGAERRFSFKHRRTKESVSLVLENGSLLDMRGETQKHWLHQLPKMKKVTEPRMSLTFRRMRT